jgi:cell wall-associated NlpC family hydrolase
MQMHWSVPYIGLAATKVGRCWGLVRVIYLEQFQIELPRYPGIMSLPLAEIADQIRQGIGDEWQEIQAPVDGCGVAMSQRGPDDLHHVGIYAAADGGRIVHCYAKQNVIADTFAGLRLKAFNTVRFYQHKLWPTS